MGDFVDMTVEQFETWLTRIPGADQERLMENARWMELRDEARRTRKVSRELLDTTGDILNEEI